ncbi:MAG: hypothetical protein CSA52_00590 [Gammaproteobacteria bacterium]|nr:MAG: hypothetical protein CSB48_06560 [Pseudomonadota bacterium]PIE38901.1 MAG: hypothetical protein CSA52_00590 [Gammaproteobacteria bacterium]
MSHKVNARAIGAFTILAIVLLVAGIFTFGSGDWFRAEYDVEMVFTGSVKGLTTGSPITFRGVRIGEVKEVNLDIAEDGKDIIIRVVGALAQGEDTRFANRRILYEFLDGQIKKGLRAQLVPQSIVTGRLQIQLEYFPLQKGYLLPDDNDNLNFPTVPTDFEVVSETLKSVVKQIDGIPLVAITEHLDSAIRNFNEAVSSDKIDRSLTELNASLVQLNRLLTGINGEREHFFEQYYQTSAAFQKMAKNVTRASQRGERLMKQTKRALDDLDGVIGQAESTLKTFEQLVEPGSDVRVRVIRTLESMERSAEQFRQLGETIERNPESVLTGKKR